MRPFAIALLLSLPFAGATLVAQAPQPAATAFDRLKAMEGEWIDVTGAFGKKGAVVATYKVTGSGNTVIESFPVGTPHEMTTVYHRDGTTLLLTHYCAGGTQPRMRAKEIKGNVMEFAFDGGTNIDPATTSHMHNMKWEWVSNDEVTADWQNWSSGKPDHMGHLHIRRKK
jgi:hypothetical protein